MTLRGWLALVLAFALVVPVEAQTTALAKKKKKKKPVVETPAEEAPAAEAKAGEEPASADTDATPKKKSTKKKKKPAVEEPVEEPLKDTLKESVAKPDDEPGPAPKKRRPVAAALSDASAETAAAPGRDGAVAIQVPPTKKVRAVTFYVDEGKGSEKATIEDQSAAKPDSILNVGRGRATEVGFKGENVTESRTGGLEDISAVFYVFSGVVKLKEMELTPVFFKKGDELEESGETPAVWRLEVLAVNRIGDTDGEVVKTLDGVAFKIGELNSIPLECEIPTGKKCAVRLSLPIEKKVNKAVFLQFKAARKGKFPANVVVAGDKDEAKANVLYNPQVRFAFVPRAGDMDTFANPAESLVGQINRYIERNGRGESEMTVPLRVKVEYR